MDRRLAMSHRRRTDRVSVDRRRTDGDKVSVDGKTSEMEVRSEEGMERAEWVELAREWKNYWWVHHAIAMVLKHRTRFHIMVHSSNIYPLIQF